MPIRRYLRVSKYTVLETRIYLDNPTILTSWFLHPRDPILPKVIEAVRDMVLPKLQEETVRVKSGGAKSKKNRAVKDIVTGDGFEVVVFLTEGGTRHALLSKMRLFQASKPRIKSTSSKSEFFNGTDEGDIYIRAESEENGGNTELHSIPMDIRVGTEDDAPKEKDVILVESSDEEVDVEKDEKKPFTQTTYDGFTIYSRVLCLVVKKLDASNAGAASGAASTANTGVPLLGIDSFAERPRADCGRGMMEDWITMTQIARQDQDAGEIEG